MAQNHLPAADYYRAGVGLQVAAEKAGDLILPGTEQACQCQDLSLGDREADIFHLVAVAKPLRRDHRRLASGGRTSARKDLAAAADHCFGQVGLLPAGKLSRRHHAAVAQHRRPVALWKWVARMSKLPVQFVVILRWNDALLLGGLS